MSAQVIKRSIIIAVVVGTLLNLINQGDAMVSGLSLNWFKVILTYCVPFAVSLVSSWFTQREIEKKNESLKS
ncbi:nitrate/nitrite transporter NrtS [Vibrio sp. MarTm2]|uniref:nitrate/nitrite transporter NrtS n=1 Tax=unclassified Vibrio TaxID=2614977 RepID=UPI0022CD6334|nr:nitrate/nitrite transporter NrtS [Vibrio sp. MarTm2]MDA0126909.1 nitrate/nitrite transporter NrtS [Vibrio sp. MarTm2]